MSHKTAYVIIAVMIISLMGGCSPKPTGRNGSTTSAVSAPEAEGKTHTEASSKVSKADDRSKPAGAEESAKTEGKKDSSPKQEGSFDGQAGKAAADENGADRKNESSKQPGETSEVSKNTQAETLTQNVPVVPDINVSEQDLELPDEAVFDAGEHSEPKEEAASGGETGNNPAETAEQTEGASAGGEENEDEGEMVIPNPVSAG